MNKNSYLIQVSFKNSFFVLELSLETVFKYVKDSQEDFKWQMVFLMNILERSGIGSKDLLTRNNIEQIVDLPGVGEHYMGSSN